MTNQEIEASLATLVKEERRITNDILSLINLAEDRKIHLERGYSSLYDWLVHGFGYSHSAAYRRLQAARLIKTVPDVKQKLQDGTVNLSTLSRAQTAIRHHEKTFHRKVSPEEAAEVVREIENKSTPQVEMALLARFPEMADAQVQERKTQISDTMTRLTFNLDNDAMADLEWVKSFLSHSVPFGEMGQIIKQLLAEYRDRHDPERKVSKPSSAAATKCVIKPAKARRLVFARAGRRCEFVDPTSGRRCNSTYQLQIDHIIPRAMGGKDEIANYRCLCAAHNRFMAEKALGKDWSNRWQRQAAKR